MVEPCKAFKTHKKQVEIARKKLVESDSTQLAEFFKLLAGETRINILLALSETELCVCDLSDALNMSHFHHFNSAIGFKKPKKAILHR